MPSRAIVRIRAGLENRSGCARSSSHSGSNVARRPIKDQSRTYPSASSSDNTILACVPAGTGRDSRSGRPGLPPSRQ
jgi:hypothetical protein